MSAKSERTWASGAVPWLAALAFCSALESTAAPLTLEDCRLHSELGGGSVAARCGWLAVPENRDQPEGKHVRLHVAVLPSLRLEPAGDPLFVWSGGPGQAAGDFYISIAPALARIRRDRDIVVVDQRGTGRSNRLDCAFPEESDAAFTDPQKLREIVRKCLAGLPGDPRYYTTSVAVRDLDEVRAALGYQQIDLYGVSYGTRVAQHYMRRYPERVRSVVLDGVVPPELALGPDVAREAQRALEQIFARCAAEAQCGARFAALPQLFAEVLTRLDAGAADETDPPPIS